MQCNPDKVIRLGDVQRRKLQATKSTSSIEDFLTVPDDTIVRVELPPQLEVELNEDGTEKPVEFYYESEGPTTDSVSVGLISAKLIRVPS